MKRQYSGLKTINDSVFSTADCLSFCSLISFSKSVNDGVVDDKHMSKKSVTSLEKWGM